MGGIQLSASSPFEAGEFFIILVEIAQVQNRPRCDLGVISQFHGGKSVRPERVLSSDPAECRSYCRYRMLRSQQYGALKPESLTTRLQEGGQTNPLFSSEAGWAGWLHRGRIPQRTLRPAIGDTGLTRRTIPVKDHLLPQYVKSVLLGNRYFRLSNYTVSILDRLTFQADHVVVRAG